jgi:hypothetical protein
MYTHKKYHTVQVHVPIYPNVCIYLQMQNKGVGVARNLTLDHERGVKLSRCALPLNAGLTTAPTLRAVVSPTGRKEDAAESARHAPASIFGAPEKARAGDEQVSRTASTMWRRDPLVF